MNGEQFLNDLGSEKINSKISFDQALAKKVDASSTPTFFLNGEALDSTVASALVQGSTAELTDLLDQKLAE
jgi:protein-disulfide isomerase